MWTRESDRDFQVPIEVYEHRDPLSSANDL